MWRSGPLDVWLPAGASHAWSIVVPNNPTLIGATVDTSGAMFTVPARNAFGAITANAIAGTIGSS